MTSRKGTFPMTIKSILKYLFCFVYLGFTHSLIAKNLLTDFVALHSSFDATDSEILKLVHQTITHIADD